MSRHAGANPPDSRRIAVSTDRIISIDAETNGLTGRAFCVAMTLSDHTGELDTFVRRCRIGDVVTNPWVAENVLPAIADVPENCPGGYPQMLADIFSTIEAWHEQGTDTAMIAHVAWPVEARLLLDVYSGERVWNGPYPLIDVASVLLAKGHDPLSVDDYLAEHGIAAPEGSPHHPLYDARAAERCFRHLLPDEKSDGPVHLVVDGRATTVCCARGAYEMWGHRATVDPELATCEGRQIDGYREPAAEHQARLAAEPKETL